MNKGLEVVIREELNNDQWKRYEIFQDTLGGRPYLFNGGLPPGGSDGSGTPGIDYQIPAEALTDEEFAAIYKEAQKYVGTPYVWGGSTPETGFDCSGYVCWVYNQNGYDVGRTTANGLWNKSQHISEAEAKPGDLVFVRKVTSENYPTDAGREGELIFRLVYQQAGCKKPFSRLWLSSMEESAIREGFAHLKPSTEYDALYNAALCRERADWMVGINASRLFSCLYGQPLAVGRVMTPVLAMTVVREAAIAAFVPEKFYTVELELTSGCTASSRRIPEKSVAENLLEACRKEMVATIQRITRKEKSENPPPLYDLTTLQRDANRLLGYSAQQTLDYVQSLYEKKLTTYPRTDSCYITDDDEDMLSKRQYELATGRRQKSDVIAYQIRQSFKPGEITAEEANKVGYELAVRFTKGKYAFIVATHTDREHIHNHIIYNSTALDSTRKFRDFLLSGLAVQRLSDLICLEHQLSVIEIKPYRERQKRILYPPKESNRDKLCFVIDGILLDEKPANFEAFLQKLEQQGYEIKRGKHTSVKGARQKRFIRFRTLGVGYSEDEIKAVIAGEAEHCPHQKQPPKEQPFHLLVDIQARLSEGKSEGYARWAKRYNLKEMSKTLIFLQENKIGSIEEMQERVDAATAHYHELGDSIKAAEQRMAEIAVLRTHIVNYARTRPVYDAYRMNAICDTTAKSDTLSVKGCKVKITYAPADTDCLDAIQKLLQATILRTAGHTAA